MRRIFGRWAGIDAAVIAVVCALAVVGMAPAFAGYGYLVAGIGGTLIGLGVAAGTRAARLGILSSALAAVVVFFLAGSAVAMPASALAGFLPNLVTLRGLALGAVFGWADVVTLAAPVGAPEYITVLPYTAGWLAGLCAGMLALRWLPGRTRTVPALLAVAAAPLALYVFASLIGTREPYLAVPRGVALIVVLLLWLAWGRSAPVAGRRVWRARILGAGGVLLVAAVAGSAATVALAPSAAGRFVLRDVVQPPFDPVDVASPLAAFRDYTKNRADSTLFTVSGLKPTDRIRLATMTSYDGRLWTVARAGESPADAGEFRLTGAELPTPTLFSPAGARDITVTMDTYAGLWLPLIGQPRRIDLPADDVDTARALRYNPQAATAVITSGVPKGLTYRVSAEEQLQPSDDDLDGDDVAPVTLPPATDVPEIVAAKATELAGDADTPIGKLRGIETAVRQGGYLSHGLASDTVTSRAGHGADRLDELFTRQQLIGDQEQYAAAFALMARSLGYPARVVMGFAPTVGEDATAVSVRGSDVTAWVEVPFEGVGWVRFDPTPDDTEIPQDQNPKPQSEPQPQVRQPPRADKPADDLLSQVDIDDRDERDKDDEDAVPAWIGVVAVAVAVPLALYAIPVLLILWWKSRRAARRRDADEGHVAAAGAWDETVDRFAELGVTAPGGLSRRRTADALGDLLPDADGDARLGDAQPDHAGRRNAAAPESGSSRRAAGRGGSAPVDAGRMPQGPDRDALRLIADAADEAVFSGRDVPRTETAALWMTVTEQTGALASRVGWWRRQVALFRVNRRRGRRGNGQSHKG